MKSTWRKRSLAGLLALALVGSMWAQAPVPDAAAVRSKADAAVKNGNWKDAYEGYRQLALDPADGDQVVRDFNQAAQCLQQLNRQSEWDALAEGVVQAQPTNWRALQAVAQSYFNGVHYGFKIAGAFQRGPHRGGGEVVNASERDRVRGMQLYQQALPLLDAEKDNGQKGQYYLNFANYLLNGRGYQEAWRLQYLSDLGTLPDYEEGWGGGGGQVQGAPVDEQGNPVYHKLPKGWAAAATDGERWRYLLLMAMESNPANKTAVQFQLANFLEQQFDVQTLVQFGWYGGMMDDEGGAGAKGIMVVHTLTDEETLARLATGIKRFKLPDEYNYIKMYQQIAADPKAPQAEQALNQLASIYLNRRQFDQAVAIYQRSIKEHGDPNKWKQQQVDQILQGWGRFEGSGPQPAKAEGAKVQLRFRNATSASFVAYPLLVGQLLEDVKAYLKTNPAQLDWQKTTIDIANTLMQDNAKRYVSDEKAAEWTLKLEPRARHFDRTIEVAVPLKKAGAYLLEGKLENGNVARTVVWLDDTVIVHQNLSKQAYYFVADAVSGAPVAKANVEFFGWQQQWDNNGKRANTTVLNFAEKSDDSGQVILGPDKLSQNYNWLVVARTDEGRLAYLGFQGVGFGNYYNQEYNQPKVFGITDRPVYRPDQAVKFKYWINTVKYDLDGPSPYANQTFKIEIHNAKNEKFFEKDYTTDEYGGLNGEVMLPRDAALGQYNIVLRDPRNQVSGNLLFRVEEYKKPEFEVTVDAPSDPVMLGEAITATVKAKYYFGAPVSKATVKYKIMRNSQDSRWYPVDRWDWLYGRGYWWFACDYDWYPGFSKWGCYAPIPPWWNRNSAPPELVAEVSAMIGADGTVKVPIDTAIAKALHADTDHAYTITAEVTDDSRRTIVGSGKVLVARAAFKVYAWVDQGYYAVGDRIDANFSAQTLDSKPVAGKGLLKLLQLSYDKDGKVVEKEAKHWDLDTSAEGKAEQQLSASAPGQYRLSYTVTDKAGHSIEGGYIFVVTGKGFDGRDYRFNAVELLPDQKSYKPGDNVKLLINTEKADSTVLLFLRPANGTYLPPKVLRLAGKSTTETFAVSKADMPNFFVEVLTIADGKVQQLTRDLVVPPEQRVLNIAVTPSAKEYLPGADAKVTLKLTDLTGEPVVGSVVVSIYDKAVEYIAGGSNVPEIKDFFWKWRRTHYPQMQSSLQRYFANLLRQKELGMNDLGIFGGQTQEDGEGGVTLGSSSGGPVRGFGGGKGGGRGMPMAPQAAMMRKSANHAALADGAMEEKAGMAMAAAAPMAMDAVAVADKNDADGGGGADDTVAPTVRQNFADTALWVGALTTSANGTAEVALKMPENLTTWKVRTWAMGKGARVAENSVDVVTTKKLILRLQAPRFFVEKDEVVLSANVHNYLAKEKKAKVVLEIDGGNLEADGATKLTQTITIPPNGEQRVDWRMKVVKEGEVTVRMKALTDEESDAMQQRFPVKVHGLDKMIAASTQLRPEQEQTSFTLEVPAARRVDTGRLEIRFSPTLAGAMVDALPYLLANPYETTDVELDRFLPAVITQHVLLKMGVDLKDVAAKRSNLNAQELGDAKVRSAQWQRYEDTKPVFDQAVMQEIVKTHVNRVSNMQLRDGGWGWFSGWGEQSSPHTTAYVVHGLQLAKDNDVAILPGVIERGVEWLKRYQAEQLVLLKRGDQDPKPKDQHYKTSADDLDAFVYMVLTDAKAPNADMLAYCYRDRTHLSVYAKCMFGIALQRQGGQDEKVKMIVQNVEQFLQKDAENQTAWLNLGNEGYWWSWYGSEWEAHAYYLQLLCATDPKGATAPWLVKYLLNNRKHASYWNSTRDTAIVVEAFAAYLKASGEDQPDETVQILIDGKQYKEEKITAQNLFTFDNAVVLTGDAVATGKHTITIRRSAGKGAVYANAYLSFFSLEDPIGRAGLEVKVNRKFFKLVPVAKTEKVAGSRGQALDQKVEKYQREELANLATLKSGELVEVELTIDSKNDYEYLVFEDQKAAGFEPVEVRSGYGRNALGAYVELHDDRVSFFVRTLARGTHSVAYRLRAEIPGKFSALPTKGFALYAPELRGNADEWKLQIKD